MTSSSPTNGPGRVDEKSNRKQKPGQHNVKHPHDLFAWPKYAFRRRSLKTFAKYCPLVSAIFAPLSTLLDIPALTQHWYARNGESQSDIKASLILSAVGLALNVIANVLLVVRFSSKTTFWWRHSTRWSLLSWIGKTLVAVVNLILFGILTRNGEGYSFIEGFWCAVISVIIAGIISVTLLFHYYFAFGHEKHDNQEIRSEGKRFMLSVTAFISILAIQSLVFAKVEGWIYSDGIYFSTQVALTIGYGDFAPVTTAGKVLIFPFSVLTISQLGNEIALIIGFISERAERRRGKWRKRYEKAMHREANSMRPKASLTEEMALIHEINSREELMGQMYDLGWSALSLIVFWMIGATLFSEIEGWPFGDAVYSCMILSLTIGFGDYTPAQPAGKIVFIVYALMAVPIVTSFAVQTITGLLSTYSERGAAKEAFLAEQKRTPEAFAPHSDFVLRYHESYGDMRKRLLEAEGDPSHDVAAGQDNEASRQSLDAEKAHGEDDIIELEETDDDPSNLTITGGRRDPNKPHKHAEEEISDDFRRVKHVLEEKKADAEGWEDDEIAHRKHKHDNETEGDEEDTNKHEDRKEDRRTREESERTRIGAPLSESGSDPTIKSSQKKKVGFEESSEERQLELDLLKQLMKRMIQLEAEARQMLLDSMDNGVARTLLLADRNVQIRDVESIKGASANMLTAWAGESERTKADQQNAAQQINTEHSSNSKAENDKYKQSCSNTGSGSATNTETSPAQAIGQLDMLSRVRRYRNTFAEILVVGSMLQKLEGEEKKSFERWREDENAEVGEREVGSSATSSEDWHGPDGTKRGIRGGGKGPDQLRPKSDGNKDNEGDGIAKDIDKVAEERWSGLTGRMWKRSMGKARKKELAKWETV